MRICLRNTLTWLRLLLMFGLCAAWSQAAWAAQVFTDETSFLAAASGASTTVDFEGIAPQDASTFLGNPGEFTDGALVVSSNSPMFVQNTNFYGTGAFLSPQQSNPETVQMTLPPDTLAVGFYYNYNGASATVELASGESFVLAASTFGQFEFVGFVSQSPITSLVLTIQGPGVDLDDLTFVQTVTPLPVFTGGGDIDQSFGVDGGLELEVVSEAGFQVVSAQSTGRLLLAGYDVEPNNTSIIEVVGLTRSGLIDPTFADNGRFTFQLGDGFNIVSDMVIAPDNSIFLAGSTETQPGETAGLVIKLDARGQLSTDFGMGGVLVDNLAVGSGTDSFAAITLQDDGKLVLGTAYYGIYRLNPDGSRDQTFFENGQGVRLPNLISSSVHMTADGGVVSGGSDQIIGIESRDFMLGKLADNGFPDSGFGDNGAVNQPVGPAGDAVFDVAVDSLGRVYALGMVAGADFATSREHDFVVIRLLADGSLDSDFGTVGALWFDDLDIGFRPTRMTMRPDDGVLFAGRSAAFLDSVDVVLASLTPSGELDTSFGGDGWAVYDPTQGTVAVLIAGGRVLEGATFVSVLSSGGIGVLGGYCDCLVLFTAPDWIDTDGDGIYNGTDTDDDGDGVADEEDVAPLDPAEFVDTDGDGIGNNADTDDDGDGVPDDADAFPLDPTESLDTDRDGVGNNADTDDDGDQLSDEVEVTVYGTNPLRADSDGDGADDAVEINAGSDPLNEADCLPANSCVQVGGNLILKLLSVDSDGDGFRDLINDAFPQDPNEHADFDGDGVGDFADADDDNDQLSDLDEEELGTDPRNPDTDGDGVVDGLDAQPLNPASSMALGLLPVSEFLATPASGFTEKVPVVLVTYIPTLDGTTLDLQEANYAYRPPEWSGNSVAALTDYVQLLSHRQKFMLEEMSRFRGYKTPANPPYLGYQVLQHYVFYEPLPLSTRTNPFNAAQQMVDFVEVLERINAENLVNELGVKEFWVNFYFNEKFQFWESNMSSPNSTDVSNSDRFSGDLPVYDSTYLVYGVNYHRTQAEAIHNHGHQIEAMLDFIDRRDSGTSELFWGAFVGVPGYPGPAMIPGRCGWTHQPPNTTIDYGYSDMTSVLVNCEDWHPDGSGAMVSVNSAYFDDLNYAWPSTSDVPQKAESQFYIWWGQNMPGEQSQIPYDETTMQNWWKIIGDWDAAMTQGISLYR